MADSYAAILDAVQAVAEGAGGHRVVTDVPTVGAYPAPAAQEAARAVAGPRYETWIKRIDPLPKGAFVEVASVKLELLTLVLRIELHPPHELESAAHREMQARAWSLERQIRAALMCPGNVSTSRAGAPTLLVSGCLSEHAGAALERDDRARRRFSILSEFRAVVATPAPMEASP